MKLKDKFILDQYTISNYLAQCEPIIIKELFEDYNAWDPEDEDFKEFDISMLKGLEEWIIEFETDGYYDNDSQNVDNYITITNPETKEYYKGYDRHNLVCGWDDVEMYYNPAPEQKKEMISIPKDEYDSMKKRLDWLECLENSGVDNWSGYCHAWNSFEEYDEE